MLEVTLLCSDEGCAELREVIVDRLAELDGITCECGRGAVVLRVAEIELV